MSIGLLIFVFVLAIFLGVELISKVPSHAYVSPCRRVHPDIDGQHRKDRADDKTQGDLPFSGRHSYKQQHESQNFELG